MKKQGIALGLAIVMFATTANAMPVSDFLSIAARIPHNPTALLRSDFRRLTQEVRESFRTLRSENATARASGRTPPNCMPERVSLSAEDVLERLEGVPTDRRSISVTQALREWMSERYPCR